MTTKLITIVFLFSAVLFGCKKQPAKATPLPSQQPIISSSFQVAIDVIVKKTDTFALYYTTDGSINFYTIPPVWQSVKGNDSLQRIIFTVPDKIIPTQFRIDFGMQQDQPNIVLRNIGLLYNNKIAEIEGPHIFDYFQNDPKLCNVDVQSGTIVAKIKDGKRRTPAIYPNPKLLTTKIKSVTQ
jgi:hypothetical protein